MASNYSGKFVRVGSTTWLPAPSTYKMTSSDFVDSARNSSGVVVSNVIRSGVRKIEMTWKFLTQAQYTILFGLFEGSGNFVHSCYYYDTGLGNYQTKDFYVSDRVSETAQMVVDLDSNNNISSIKGYADVKLSLIEV